ncbi:MAG: hypothetical protein HOP28_00145, partial [Gemmatimonadales bacterium]|nr:hypothetical protein [Gemmatimonadales bacterium]
PVPVATVTVTPGTVTLVPQQTQPLAAVNKDAQGAILTGRAVAWSTNAPGVATVNATTGLVTAMAPGSATLTATAEGKTGTAAITVRDGGMIGAAGGQVSGAAGNVTVVFPASAVTAAIPVSLAPVATPPADPNLIPGTAYDLGPSPTTFAQPVTVRIRYPATGLPAGAVPANFRLHRLTGSTWAALPGSTVDVATRTVSGQTTTFSTYAILEVDPPAPPAPPLAEGSLVSGGGHVCGLTAAGEAWCWGGNGSAQLGDGTTADRFAPVRAAPGTTFKMLAAAGSFTCGLTIPGAVRCWGQSFHREFGDGTAGSSAARPTPATFQMPEAAVYVAATFGSVCAIGTSGSAWCSGKQLGMAAETKITVPAKIPGTVKFTRILPGFDRACGLDASGTMYCWGSDIFGTLGTGGGRHPEPRPVLGNRKYVAIYGVDTFNYWTCGLTDSGALWCWGANDGGIFGDTRTSSAAARAAGTLTFKQVASFQTSMCGRLSNDAWRCWGTGSPFPDEAVHLPETKNFGAALVTLAGTPVYTCGLTAQGAAMCLGQNLRGALGQGYGDFTATPLFVGGPLRAKSISVGANAACAVSTAGDPWCWGALAPDAPDPVRIATGTGLTTVATGGEHACGLDGAGRAQCWGKNYDGVLGDGTTTHRTTPAPVSGPTRFTALTSGDYHTCGIATDKTAWCWGWGEVPNAKIMAPRQINATWKFNSLQAGGASTCGITDEPKLVCWDFADGATYTFQGGAPDRHFISSTPFSLFTTHFTKVDVRCTLRKGFLAIAQLICEGQGWSGTPNGPATWIDFKEYVVSRKTGCGFDQSGKGYCWGSPLQGALGDGGGSNGHDLVAVATSERFIAMSAASDLFSNTVTCGIATGNRVLCWGEGLTGRLGAGMVQKTATVIAVSGGKVFQVFLP